jgi:nucleoside phosphorylase
VEDVVVFAALAWEARAALDALQGVEPDGVRRWRGYLGDGAAVRVLQIGIGLERAERRSAVGAGSRLYVSCGCAGALAPELRAGDLVVADRVTALGDAAGDAVPTAHAALAAWSASRGLRVRVGTVASSPAVVPPAAKQRAAGQGALAVDMECAAVAAAARARGLACTVVKVVLDELDDEVGFPGDDAIDPDTGELDVRRALSTLGRHPRWWPRAVRLARRQRLAERRLREYLALLFSAGLDAFGCGAPGARALAG